MAVAVPKSAEDALGRETTVSPTWMAIYLHILPESRIRGVTPPLHGSSLGFLSKTLYAFSTSQFVC
jgi:hypothetical protein